MSVKCHVTQSLSSDGLQETFGLHPVQVNARYKQWRYITSLALKRTEGLLESRRGKLKTVVNDVDQPET